MLDFCPSPILARFARSDRRADDSYQECVLKDNLTVLVLRQCNETGPGTCSRVRVVSLILIRHYSIEARAAGREWRSLRSLSSVGTVSFDLETVKKELSPLPVPVIGIETADPPDRVSTLRTSELPVRPIRIDGWGELDDAVCAS